MSGTGSSAIVTMRLIHDAWRTGDVSDLQLLRGLLSEAEPEELRNTVEEVGSMAIGLAVVLEKHLDDFTFDSWLAVRALAGVAGDAP